MDACEIEVENKKRKYLITVDHYSDFYEIDELKDFSGKTTVEICKRNFARHCITLLRNGSLNTGVRKLPELNVGQEVIVKLKSELSNKWSPGVIQEELTDRSFIVNVRGKTFRRNENHIKQSPYNQTTELSTGEGIEKKP
ncbi:hypothetical protein QE152_g34065 [Popillia japonica]|uniref:Uncharacterized protein n=1 Tax=Popillia japonica TaxID=7064 RepID=A0AAW1IUZ5_POPJA